MRMNTALHICARDVGLAGSEDHLFHHYGPIMEGFKALMLWIANRPLNRRFDVCMGRTKEECDTRLLLVARTPSRNEEGKLTPRSFDSMFSAEELEQMGANSGIEGDDWMLPK